MNDSFTIYSQTRYKRIAKAKSRLRDILIKIEQNKYTDAELNKLLQDKGLQSLSELHALHEKYDQYLYNFYANYQKDITIDIESSPSNAIEDYMNAPPVSNKLYHEKQQSQNCAVHAFNNAMQFKAITQEQAQQEADLQLQNYVNNRLDRYTKRIQDGLTIRKSDEPYTPEKVLAYSQSLSSNGTMFSPGVIMSLAKQLNIGFLPEPVTSNGSYYLIGLSGKMGNTYKHSIACVDGNYIDSEYDKIFKSPPWHFQKQESYKLIPLDQLKSLNVGKAIHEDEIEYLPQPPALPENQILETSSTNTSQNNNLFLPSSPFHDTIMAPSKKWNALVATNMMSHMMPPMKTSTPKVKSVPVSTKSSGNKKLAALGALKFAMAEKSIPSFKAPSSKSAVQSNFDKQFAKAQKSLTGKPVSKPKAYKAMKKASSGGDNPWVAHVKEWSKAHNKSYACAVTDPACRSAYKK